VDGSYNGSWVLFLSYLVAYVLAMLPLPEWAGWVRPEWVALVLIYWTIALPHRVGVGTALLLGLGLDVMEGAPLGQNALALLVLAVVCLTLYQRIRFFNMGQQAAVVFLLVGVHQLICQWVQALQGLGVGTLAFLLPALTSALLWPVVFILLRSLRRRHGVV